MDEHENIITDEHMKVIANTPENCDPVVYWHRVAMDAIDSQNRERERTKTEREELDKFRRRKECDARQHEQELKNRAFPNINDLLYRVKIGDFSMNIQFSFYPNTERRSNCYEEE